MKCIYCNSDKNLTSSDIITYAITGAKLTKSFVCKTHNAFTNDNYEKKFVADLDCFRNHLGLTTRDGKTIQYKADLIVNGMEIRNAKLSNRGALFSPKSVVSGTDDQGNKTILAPMELIDKISDGKGQKVDLRDITWHKSFKSDYFLGFHSLHSIAKMAYEWYCYNNNIEEYKEEYTEIVNYILNKSDGDYVDIIVDGNYYYAIDKLSEIGTNSFFQYDDIDGYRYVVFDFWNTISYRIRMCKAPNMISLNSNSSFFNLFRYHIDGRKTQTSFGTISLDSNKKPILKSIKPEKIKQDTFQVFVNRINKIMTTIIFSIYSLKREVDEILSNLKKYDEKKISFARLIGYEENRTVFAIEIINQLYMNKERYDMNKSFNANMSIVLDLKDTTIKRTEYEKKQFIKELVYKDKEKELSDYLWKRVAFFYEVYENEIKLVY